MRPPAEPPKSCANPVSGVTDILALPDLTLTGARPWAPVCAQVFPAPSASAPERSYRYCPTYWDLAVSPRWWWPPYWSGSLC